MIDNDDKRYGLWMPSGVRIRLDEPKWTDIRPSDIAWVLARKCRFGGCLRAGVSFYSVAQHSVLVSHLVPAMFARPGLMHDAAEAFTGDITRPQRRVLASERLEIMERAWNVAIEQRFHLVGQLQDLPYEVRRADDMALAIEAQEFYWAVNWESDLQFDSEELEIIKMWPKLEPLCPEDAQASFMARYNELWPDVDTFRDG